MAKGRVNIAAELARYFREMSSNATTHDKVMLAIVIAILAGCGASTCRGLIASKQWPVAVALLLSLVAETCIWILGFALGIKLRAPAWRDVFPPYKLIGRGMIPAVVVGMAVGCVLGPALSGVTATKAAIASSLGQLSMLAMMHLLFVLYAPVTRKAVQITHNPNIMTVDSHRYIWLFPALGVLVVFLVGRAIISQDAEALRHIATAAATATSAILAGFGSGFIPQYA